MIVIKNCRGVGIDEVKEKAKDTYVQWLITEKDRAKNFFMRLFTIKPGGYTPLHSHNWEHEIFILEGVGKIISDEKEMLFKNGDVIFIPPNEEHQFLNTGENIVKFICLIPKT
jgi:quercetin dioxygenase-like cupin family protein